MKVFVVGRPGCGKSRAARRIVKLAKEQMYSAIRVNDYPILRSMFRADKEGKQFKAIEGYEGFDVIDFTVLERALKTLETKVLEHKDTYDVIVLEFARDDYLAALKQFSNGFLKDAHFLFIDTDIETCIQRIHRRVACSATPDDYFVSEKILKCYYGKQYFPPDLVGQMGIEVKHMWSIHNKGSKQEFDQEVSRFVGALLKQKQQATRTVFQSWHPVTGILKKIRQSHSFPVGVSHN